MQPYVLAAVFVAVVVGLVVLGRRWSRDDDDDDDRRLW